jgi:hypothetical protein
MGNEQNLIAEFTVPQQFSLSPIYPNPFNARFSATVNLPVSSGLTIQVLNSLGRKVAVLTDGNHNAGIHSFTFDAKGFASGTYFLKASVPGISLPVQKAVLLK